MPNVDRHDQPSVLFLDLSMASILVLVHPSWPRRFALDPWAHPRRVYFVQLLSRCFPCGLLPFMHLRETSFPLILTVLPICPRI